MSRPLLLATIALLATAGPGAAQTNERIYEELDFRFVTPGARAMGMGQAFIGVADDATAANSNPAGLSNLLEPEFSIEFTVTGIRHHRLVPREQAPVGTQAFGETVLVPSFFSYAVPAGSATFLLFRNAVQDYRESFEIGQRSIDALQAFEDGAFGTIRARVENYGVGGSYVVNANFSIGGSLVLSAADIATSGRSGSRDNPRNGTDTIDADTVWTGIAGVLVKPHPRLSLGAAYYGGSTFELETTLFGEFLVNGFDVRLTGTVEPVDYVVPDRYSGGASWRVRNSLTVAADFSRVRYSRLITDRFLVIDFRDPAAGLDRDNFRIPDVTELHAGAEYRWYRPEATLAFRGGIFTDPDHQMRYDGTGSNPAHVADRLLDFRFNSVPSRTDVGATLGAGIALRDRFQVDIAGSFSRDATQLVVSTVVRLR